MKLIKDFINCIIFHEHNLNRACLGKDCGYNNCGFKCWCSKFHYKGGAGLLELIEDE